MKYIHTEEGKLLLIHLTDDIIDWEFLTDKKHIRLISEIYNNITGYNKCVDIDLNSNIISHLNFEILGKSNELKDKKLIFLLKSKNINVNNNYLIIKAA